MRYWYGRQAVAHPSACMCQSRRRTLWNTDFISGLV